jgi:hypothetical protein
MPPDHAKLGSQEIPENAEANNVAQFIMLCSALNLAIP